MVTKKLNDWEFEDYLREKEPKLWAKVIDGEISFEKARRITGIQERLE